MNIILKILIANPDLINNHDVDKRGFGFLCIKFLQLLFYPQLKLIMDAIFFILLSGFCGAMGMIGFFVFALFPIYFVLWIIPKTRKIGFILLEITGIVLSFFFFKFMIFGLFIPYLVYNYFKTYVFVCKGVITPTKTFMENLEVLKQDYYDIYNFVMKFAEHVKNSAMGPQQNEYEEVPKV